MNIHRTIQRSSTRKRKDRYINIGIYREYTRKIKKPRDRTKRKRNRHITRPINMYKKIKINTKIPIKRTRNNKEQAKEEDK